MEQQQRDEESDALTTELLAAMQDISVTCSDCGTSEGIEIVISNPLPFTGMTTAKTLVGRVSCETYLNPYSENVVVRAGELITESTARELESAGLERFRVRSTIQCEAEKGVCQHCYGLDRSTGELAQVGSAAGTIAAFAIGAHAHELTLRTFRIGGDPYKYRDAAPRARLAGTVHHLQLPTVTAMDGVQIALGPGEIAVRDRRQRDLQRFAVSAGARIYIRDGAEVNSGEAICEWDPDSIPLVARCAGQVKFVDVVFGVNCKSVEDSTKPHRLKIASSVGLLRPRLVILDVESRPIEVRYLAEQLIVDVADGQSVVVGDILARLPVGTPEYRTAPLSTLREILAAGPTHDTTVLAPASGVVLSIESDPNADCYVIQMKCDNGEFCEIAVPYSQLIRYGIGEEVRRGDALTHLDRVNPVDEFRTRGFENGVQAMMRRLRYVFDLNRISIDDRYLELVIRRMLSIVEVEAPGNTDFVAGEVVDRRKLKQENDRVLQCVCIAESMVPELVVGQIVRRDVYEKCIGDLSPERTVRASPAVPATAITLLTSISSLE